MTVDGPHPGNWFGVAFISWTDPNNERIEQQGNETQTVEITRVNSSNGAALHSIIKNVIKCFSGASVGRVTTNGIVEQNH